MKLNIIVDMSDIKNAFNNIMSTLNLQMADKLISAINNFSGYIGMCGVKFEVDGNVRSITSKSYYISDLTSLLDTDRLKGALDKISNQILQRVFDNITNQITWDGDTLDVVSDNYYKAKKKAGMGEKTDIREVPLKPNPNLNYNALRNRNNYNINFEVGIDYVKCSILSSTSDHHKEPTAYIWLNLQRLDDEKGTNYSHVLPDPNDKLFADFVVYSLKKELDLL